MSANRRLKAARVLKGLTQLQLAGKVGCKEIDVSRYETGRAQPGPDTRRRIGEVLEKRVYELFSE